MFASSVSAPRTTNGSVRRYVEGTAAVAVWMGLGVVFHLSANAYLLVGLPITIIFQLYVRRAPLRAMWVASAPPFYLGIGGTIIVIVLSISPLVGLVQYVRSHQSPASTVWMLTAMLGAWAAAYAFRNFTRETLREVLIALVTAGAVGCVIMIALLWIQGTSDRSVGSRVSTGVVSFLQYVPVLFLLEEVWFRGVLDSHLHRPGAPHGALSAVYVSALWGLWHLPLTEAHGPQDLLATTVTLLVVHISIGVLLSWAWRRSGNLLVPGTAHALIDAVRNAIL